MSKEQQTAYDEVDEVINEARITVKRLIDEGAVDFGSRENRRELCEDFGAKLRALREERNVSLNSFASKTGLDPSYVSRAERGLRTVTMGYLYAASEELEIPIFDSLVQSGQLEINHSRITENDLEIFELAVNTKLIRFQ